MHVGVEMAADQTLTRSLDLPLRRSPKEACSTRGGKEQVKLNEDFQSLLETHEDFADALLPTGGCFSCWGPNLGLNRACLAIFPSSDKQPYLEVAAHLNINKEPLCTPLFPAVMNGPGQPSATSRNEPG